MNILFLTHHDTFQGSSRSLLSLLEGLHQYDIHPLVVTPKESLFTRSLADHSIKVEVLALPWWLSRKRLSLGKKVSLVKQVDQSAKTLQKLIWENQVNLVYTNSSVTPVGRLAAWREGIPHIWHIREFGELDFLLKFIFPKWISMGLIRSSQAIICNSQAVRLHHFKTWSNAKLHVIYNGVANQSQFEQLATRNHLRPQNDIFTFLIIGSISPKKGQETAIKALAELINKGLRVRLIIAGSGRDEYMDHCHSLAVNLAVSAHVEFTGFLPDPYEVYDKADCLLMCSEHEAFGRVTAEAMSACLPVIGRNSGGTPEVIVDGETGVLYNTFDELVEAMIKLLENPTLARSMGQAGAIRARHLFNIEDYAANVYSVIKSVMEK